MPAEQNDIPVEQVDQPRLLALSASTEAYLPGEELILSWEIGDWSSVSETEPELALRIPVDFAPMNLPVDAIVEGDDMVIHLPLKLVDYLTVRVSEKAEGSYFIRGELVVGDKILGQDWIKLVQDSLTIIGVAGGLAQSLDGRIKVTFPANVDANVSEATPLRVHIHPLTEKAGVPYTVSLMPFEIDAEIVSPDGSKSAVEQFDKEFTITADYDDEWIKGDESTLNLKTYNEQNQAWEPVSSWVDTTNNRVTAHVDHMSPWDFSTEDWQASLLPNVKDFQVSNFSGAATYSFPIQVPPGPGGLQPSLRLTYNSQVVDNATGLTQSSWVGMGWSFETGYIQRNLNGTMNYLADDTYFISLNGLGGTLYLGTDGYYHTEDENFLRIQHVILHDPNYGEYEESYWIVYAKDGTRYFLGENPADRADYNIWDSCDGGTPSKPVNKRTVTWRWALNRVVNIYDKELNYYNEVEGNQINSLCDEADNSYIDHFINPRYISYPHEPNKPSYRIEFKRLQDRKDWAWYWSYGSAQNFFMQARLKEIEIQHDADGDGLYSDDPIIRKFVLTYAQDQGSGTIFPNYIWDHNASVPDVWKKTLTLKEIQEYGYNGATGLPAVKFSYDDMHLTKGENGYGGEVTFEYTGWHEITTSDSYSLIQNFGAAGNPCYDPNQEGGWGGYLGGQVSCVEDEEDPNYGMLRIYNFAGRGIEPGLLRPGGYYLTEVRMKEIVSGDSVELGLYDGYGEQTGPLTTLYGFLTTITYVEKIPATASKYARWLIKTYTHGLVDTFIDRPLLTRYRVTIKTIKDGTTGQTSTYTYTYDEPATNDVTHSTYIASIPDEYGQYTKAYSEFRGHAMVKEYSPAGLVSASFYNQDDLKRGRATATLASTEEFAEVFDTFRTAYWSNAPANTPVTVQRIAGDNALVNYNPQANWNQVVTRLGNTLSDGDMVLTQFRYSAETGHTPQAVLAVENTESPYLRWGIYYTGSVVYAQYNNGGGFQTPATLFSSLQQSKWYVLLMVIDDDNGFYTRIWERDNPAVMGQYRCTGGCSMMPGKTWHFKQWSWDAAVVLDEYSEGKVHLLNDYIYANQTTPVTPLPIQGSGYYYGLQYAWSYLNQDRAYRFADGSQHMSTSTYYRYEAADQGGVQYGNLTQTIESAWDAAAGAFRDYRISWTGYYPNTSGVYLVGLPGYTNTYRCRDNTFNGACYADIQGLSSLDRCALVTGSQLFLYDGAFYDLPGNYSTPPTAGKLTGKRTLVNLNQSSCTGLLYTETKLGYDSWGNQNSTTVYPGYGTISMPNLADPRTTTITYDANYHTYPVQVSNPLGHLVNTSYNYALGVPTAITDSNNVTTYANYDGFGRILNVVRPGHGDTEESPTVSLSYHIPGAPFLNNPFWTEAVQKIEGTQTFKIRKYYNGLGQLIQTQAVGAEVNGAIKDILTDYYYDMSGRLYRQSVPYAVTTGGNYHARDQGQPYTLTTFDVLDRALSVTAPDGTPTSYSYTILGTRFRTRVTDPRGNITDTYSDAWGRTVEVDPPDGPGVSYAYDTSNRLVSANYGGANTTLTYDYAGRKTGMDDADMGIWSYAYNALGSLVRQTDARSQTTCLYYDTLNRLKGKNYRSDVNCPGSDPGAYTVTFTFDSTAGGNYGVGRRTGMTDASGSTNWVYDWRGRVTSESKTIDGQTYITAWQYNTADLVKRMAYPSGEVITYNYTPQMTLDTLAGFMNYLADSTYDEAGRVRNRSLNSGELSQAFTYNDWTEKKTVEGQLVGQGARLENILTTGPQGGLQNLAYVYDAAGNVKSIADTSVPGSPETHDYTYDPLNRLTGWNMNTAPQETYGYNASTGNLAYKGSPSLTLLYNDGDHPHAATAYNGWGYSYDENGNTVTRHEPGQAEQTLVYDAENRLALVHTGIPGQPVAEYTYDGDGNLVKAEEGGKVTVYIGPHFEACLSGCAPAGITPTPTPTAAATATPTSTATATATATSTPTPTPTTTATPTPTATATATPTPTSTSTPAGPYTFTSQPDASGLDTYLSKSSPNSTHGAIEYIAVGEEAGANDKVRRSLLTFDLSSLPANAVVQSATLSLWMYNEISTKDRTLRVYRLLRTWDEASATWNQASSGVNWQTAGANGAADRESTAIGSRAFTANESTGEKQFSLDAAKVQEWISGGLENRGMIVIADTERDDQYYFRSSDYTTASQRPKLVIVYTLAQGSAAPMQSVRANVSYSGGFQSSGVSQGNGPAKDIARVVKSRPRQEKGLRVQLSLVREPGVVWRSYYFAGASRIAMREDSDAGSKVYYLFSDHLGSTSVSYRVNNGQVERQWYKPWGELRPGPGSSLPTDYQYTGQRNAGWGLYYFKARWFDSQLGRFAQADTIIPGMGLSIAWDRYAGLLNNPVKYVDPSGHRVTCEVGENCAQEQRLFRFTGERYWKALIKDEFGIIMSNQGDKPWDFRNLQFMYTSLSNVDKILNGKFGSLVKGATFKLMKQDTSNGGQYHGITHTNGPTGIDFYTVGDDAIRQMNIYHEVGHLLDNTPGSKDVFMNAVDNEDNPSWVSNGYIDEDALISKRINDPNYALGPRAIQAYEIGAAEEWADAFANYVAGNIDLSKASGTDMFNFVTDALAPYIGNP